MKKIKEEKVVFKGHKNKSAKFIKSMDYDWFVSVAKLSGKGPLLIGIGLYFWASKMRRGFNREFDLSISRLGKEFGVNESTAYRGLKSLVRAKLVTIRHNIGKKPSLILHEVPSDLSPIGTDDSSSGNSLFENLDNANGVVRPKKGSP